MFSVLRYAVGMLCSFAIVLTVLMGLIYTLRPDVTTSLQLLSQWVWNYLLIDPLLYLPNTNELSIEERRHLLDVKRVLRHVHWVWWLSCGIALLTGGGIGYWQGWQAIRSFMRISAWLIVSITVLSGLVAFVDFSGSFNELHGLFFKANTWVFPTNSTIIRLFPFAYFQTFAIYWGSVNVLIASLLLFLLRRSPRLFLHG